MSRVSTGSRGITRSDMTTYLSIAPGSRICVNVSTTVIVSALSGMSMSNRARFQTSIARSVSTNDRLPLQVAISIFASTPNPSLMTA